MSNVTILQGDCREVLKTLSDGSAQCVVTSPPYFGLRDYGNAGQIGQEPTPDAYVAEMVSVFREVWRVLKDDGTVWLNLGDSYAARKCGCVDNDAASCENLEKHGHGGGIKRQSVGNNGVSRKAPEGLKPKDLIGIPWRVAFALQSYGWYLRSEITWCKKVPMPESVIDRPTAATEKVFLLTKSRRYFYDAEAVRNSPSESFLKDSRWKTGPTDKNKKSGYEAAGAQNPKKLHRIFKKDRGHERPHVGMLEKWDSLPRDHHMAYGSNMRNYWVLGPELYSESHFATFPTLIPKRCILAGTKPGDMVLDPFGGSGTTGMVARELGRSAILIELNPYYAKLAEDRCNVTPGLALA